MGFVDVGACEHYFKHDFLTEDLEERVFFTQGREDVVLTMQHQSACE